MHLATRTAKLHWQGTCLMHLEALSIGTNRCVAKCQSALKDRKEENLNTWGKAEVAKPSIDLAGGYLMAVTTRLLVRLQVQVIDCDNSLKWSTPNGSSDYTSYWNSSCYAMMRRSCNVYKRAGLCFLRICLKTLMQSWTLSLASNSVREAKESS